MSNETGRVVPTITEMFRYQCWMALGKVANPATQEIERDLIAAKHMIDLLAELETKTEGNLSDDETQMLKGTLTELRLNYVDESNKPQAEDESNEAEDGPGESDEETQQD